MGTAVAAPASPLLAAGPPGWLAYAVIVVGATVVTAVVVHEATKDDARSTSTSTTKTGTARRTCDRPYTVVVHAQGRGVGGTTGATVGATPVVKPTIPVTVAEGLVLSTATFGMLNKSQKRTYAPAKARLDTWMSRLPPNGFLGKHSAYGGGAAQRGGNRFDCDSYGCTPNFVS